jgi:hypothetical protein
MAEKQLWLINNLEGIVEPSSARTLLLGLWAPESFPVFSEDRVSSTVSHL